MKETSSPKKIQGNHDLSPEYPSLKPPVQPNFQPHKLFSPRDPRFRVIVPNSREGRPLKYIYSSKRMKKAGNAILNELQNAFEECIVRHLPRNPILMEKRGLDTQKIIQCIQDQSKSDHSFLSLFGKTQMFEVFLLEFYQI
jgi:hypothetical protein